MFRQPSKWLVVALVGGVFFAGCGSSSSSSSSTTSGSTGTSSITVPTGAGVAQAIASCKSVVQKAPTLSSTTKAKIEGICEKAGTDPAAARTAAKEVCVEVVNASPIPSGSIKEKALAACNKSS
jgi:hypothetical protein